LILVSDVVFSVIVDKVTQGDAMTGNVVSGVLAEESKAMLQSFFQSRRNSTTMD